jgi:hypothetical protein
MAGGAVEPELETVDTAVITRKAIDADGSTVR